MVTKKKKSKKQKNKVVGEIVSGNEATEAKQKKIKFKKSKKQENAVVGEIVAGNEATESKQKKIKFNKKKKSKKQENAVVGEIVAGNEATESKQKKIKFNKKKISKKQKDKVIGEIVVCNESAEPKQKKVKLDRCVEVVEPIVQKKKSKKRKRKDKLEGELVAGNEATHSKQKKVKLDKCVEVVEPMVRKKKKSKKQKDKVKANMVAGNGASKSKQKAKLDRCVDVVKPIVPKKKKSKKQKDQVEREIVVSNGATKQKRKKIKPNKDLKSVEQVMSKKHSKNLKNVVMDDKAICNDLPYQQHRNVKENKRMGEIDNQARSNSLTKKKKKWKNEGVEELGMINEPIDIYCKTMKQNDDAGGGDEQMLRIQMNPKKRKWKDEEELKTGSELTDPQCTIKPSKKKQKNKLLGDVTGNKLTDPKSQEVKQGNNVRRPNQQVWPKINSKKSKQNNYMVESGRSSFKEGNQSNKMGEAYQQMQPKPNPKNNNRKNKVLKKLGFFNKEVNSTTRVPFNNGLAKYKAEINNIHQSKLTTSENPLLTEGKQLKKATFERYFSLNNKKMLDQIEAESSHRNDLQPEAQVKGFIPLTLTTTAFSNTQQHDEEKKVGNKCASLSQPQTSVEHEVTNEKFADDVKKMQEFFNKTRLTNSSLKAYDKLVQGEHNTFAPAKSDITEAANNILDKRKITNIFGKPLHQSASVVGQSKSKRNSKKNKYKSNSDDEDVANFKKMTKLQEKSDLQMINDYIVNAKKQHASVITIPIDLLMAIREMQRQKLSLTVDERTKMREEYLHLKALNDKVMPSITVNNVNDEEFKKHEKRHKDLIRRTMLLERNNIKQQLLQNMEDGAQ